MKRKQASIQPPQLPTPLPGQPESNVALISGELYSQQLWLNLSLDLSEAEEFSFEQLIVRNVSFQQTELRLLQSIDCRYDACDFANAALEKAYMRRNEFTGCRMLGLKLMDADLQDISFAACNFQLLRCWTSHLKAVRFEHCNFREASFDGTDLSGVVFYKCDLSQADLRNTKLKGADLRGSSIAGMQVLGKDLAGVIIDPGQALELIQLFGVTVRTEEQ